LRARPEAIATVTFDGEFSDITANCPGKDVVRYQW
jgi:hypothetical protein